MRRIVIAFALAFSACHSPPDAAPVPDAGHDVALAAYVPPYIPPIPNPNVRPVADPNWGRLDAGPHHRLGSSQPGHLHREDNFIDGTGISVSVVDNATTGQADITVTNTAPGGGGASSVTGAGATSCSPTTGAVVCTTPSVTVTASTGISVGGGPAYTVALSTPVSAANGGTGNATNTAHAVLIGEGTSAVGFAGPNALTGIPLVSQGASADPSFATASVVGGGTASNTLTAHAVLLGAGTSPVAFAGPNAVAGIPLVSNGASADPGFSTVLTVGGGTGLNTPGTSGNVLTSNGSTWASAAPLSTQGHFATGSVVGLSGTTPVTVATTTFTTPNDGITHTWLVHTDFTINNTNSSGIVDQVTCGASLDSTSTLTGPFSLQSLNPGSGVSGGWNDSASNTVSMSLAPNTSHTIRAMVYLAALGGTGDSVAASLSAIIIA